MKENTQKFQETHRKFEISRMFAMNQLSPHLNDFTACKVTQENVSPLKAAIIKSTSSTGWIKKA